MERSKRSRNSNKGNQGAGKGNKTLRKEQAKNRQDSGSYIEARKGENKLYRRAALRPPNRV